MAEFQSFGAFGKHLAAIAVRGEAVASIAADEGARVIAADARDRIGTYQDAVGPFRPWMDLAESTVNDRIAKGFTPDDPLLRSGALRESIKTADEGGVAAAVSDDPVALWQELGTMGRGEAGGGAGGADAGGIPPRPFMGPAGYSTKVPVTSAIFAVVLRWLAGQSLSQLRLRNKVPVEGKQD